MPDRGAGLTGAARYYAAALIVLGVLAAVATGRSAKGKIVKEGNVS
ncbi:MAG TPA: hypothetical protein VGG75_25160 [Trebonia sp.]|jgi:hypothetical protein